MPAPAAPAGRTLLVRDADCAATFDDGARARRSVDPRARQPRRGDLSGTRVKRAAADVARFGATGTLARRLVGG